MTPVELAVALDAEGLQILGHLSSRDDEAIPPIAEGVPAGSLALIGHVGSSHWAAFTASPEYLDGQPDPLDRWSRRIGEALADSSGGRALYPFEGPPFHPFQRWAMRARPVHVSPLGILIDPEFGLWHAWRFALLLPTRLGAVATPLSAAAPCRDCTERPCLNACPAGAASMEGFDHRACARHLLASESSVCREQTCRARDACPVATQWKYVEPHARFHMNAFLAGLR